MNLIALPAFTDNYIWMLHNSRSAIVVDPGDAGVVLDALARLNVQLQSILVTHHHNDHTGGVTALRGATGAAVYGPKRETMLEPIQRLDDGDQVQALGLTQLVAQGMANKVSIYEGPTKSGELFGIGFADLGVGGHGDCAPYA